jgi:hypothetical protein
MKKTNFKIIVELIKEGNACISARLGDKTLIASVKGSGNAHVVADALAGIYTNEYWKLTIE